MEKDFHIAVVYQEPIIGPDVVAGFEEDIQSLGLKVLVESAPMIGTRAALDWLMPTAIVAYIAKSYFESFLREMGKDHYAITKKTLNNLHARIQSKFGERLRKVASKGKVSHDAYIYSPVFSIEAQSPFGFKIKLLVQTEIQPEHFNLAVEAFLRLLSESYGTEEVSEQSKSLLSNNTIGSVLLVCFNHKTGELEYVHPISERKKP